MTAPSTEAMQSAREWLNTSDLHDVTDCDSENASSRANAPCSFQLSLALSLDAFALIAVQKFRIEHGKGDALAVGKRAWAMLEKGMGKVGIGVTEQEIACDVEAFRDEAVRAEREAILAKVREDMDQYEEDGDCYNTLGDVVEMLKKRDAK